MVTAPFAGALLAAVCFGVASVLQHTSAARTGRTGALDLRLLARLGRDGPYLAGLALDVAGFALSAWAVRLVPLFVVQAALASSLAVTAVVAAAVAREALGPVERRAVAGIVAGLALLGVSAGSADGVPARGATTTVLLAGLPLLAFAAWVAGRRGGSTRPGMALGATAGLSFAGFGVAGRVLDGSAGTALAADPVAWALVGYVVLGFLAFAAALQRAAVTKVTAACVVAETLVPAAVGVVVFGDGARPGYAAVAACGFALTTAAALRLARHDGGAPSPRPVQAVVALEGGPA